MVDIYAAALFTHLHPLSRNDVCRHPASSRRAFTLLLAGCTMLIAASLAGWAWPAP